MVDSCPNRRCLSQILRAGRALRDVLRLQMRFHSSSRSTQSAVDSWNTRFEMHSQAFATRSILEGLGHASPDEFENGSALRYNPRIGVRVRRTFPARSQ